MKTIHIVPHAHWDREWYMPFEEHRYRLVELIDALIELMEDNDEYKYFHLDGQIILIEDYLEIKPNMKDRLMKLIYDNRIQIGPWYVLHDEFLVSSEANVRNMLIGLKISKEMGAKPVMTGYLPDSFGNISQMPQILNGFNIHSAVFGRGGKDNAEIIWESVDGSQVVGVWLPGWYHNAKELPMEEEASRARMDKICSILSKASKIDDYLGLNGSDHQPVQLDLCEAIDVANKVVPDDTRVIHSNLKDYLEIVQKDSGIYPVVKGELAGQNSHGLNRLVGTASSRIYLKQANHRAQNLLEREAEPLSAMAYSYGMPYENDFLLYAWKTLLKNHAHDSICGCSVDEVHREMMTRFEKVIQLASKVKETATDFIVKRIDTSKVEGYPLAVFNTSLYSRTGYVTGHIDLAEEIEVEEIRLLDASGKEIPCLARCLPHTFKYILPDDSFREVEYVNRWEISFTAENIPPMGYTVYTAQPGKAAEFPALSFGDKSMENEWVRLDIADDGALSVLDKDSQVSLHGLNTYEDVGDKGDEYMFKQAGSELVTTRGKRADIKLQKATADKVTFRIEHLLDIPRGYDRDNDLRTKEETELKLESYVSLERCNRQIDVKTIIHNTAENHRLCAVFPNDIKTDKVLADGQFEIVERSINTCEEWKNPTNEQRLQAFVALKDEGKAMMVATKGLHEYEVARDGSNKLQVTLLRSVDILGDWGDFPTPEAQCLGENIAEYSIIVGSSADYADMVQNAQEFHSGSMTTKQVPALQQGNLPLVYESFSIEGKSVFSTALKKTEHRDSLILRLYNTLGEENNIVLKVPPQYSSLYACNLGEERQSADLLSESKVTLTFRPMEIKTLELILAKKTKL